MTSAQLMQCNPRAAMTAACARAIILFLLPLLATLAPGCSPTLVQPVTLAAPYPQRQVWAVVPFTNESGVSVLDGFRVADLCAMQAQQVYGVDTLPVNRVIAAMRQAGLEAVQSPGDAMLLMNALDVDGLIVGTVTAYDPYPPPTIGAAAELHLRGVRERWSGMDPQTFTREIRGEASAGEVGPRNPIAQAAGVFDARNHQTLAWLDEYATGRSVPDSAFGQDVYLYSIELYTQFVCYRLLHDLLASEQARLQPVAVTETQQQR
jgi:hypothetical protein